MLAIRVASYGTIECIPRCLSKSMDLTLPRSSTIQQLMETLAKRFPFLCEDAEALLAASGADAEASTMAVDPGLQTLCRQIAVAKAYSSGPPLSLREIVKLKWNDSAMVLDGSIAIDKPPLNLRDGSVIVVRGQADYLRARAAAKLKKEQEEASGVQPTRPSSRGSLRPGSRGALRPKSRGTALRARPKEKQLQLRLQSQSGVMDADGVMGGYSHDENTPGDMPNAPVRMVKALRDGERESA